MISHLRGTLVSKSPTEAVVDVQGTGYQIHITLPSFQGLPEIGSPVKFLTHLHVREDLLQLYGFISDIERQIFRMLISISGIGPKMAQGILSGMSTEELKDAILKGNVTALTSISGVGKKTAERLIIELRDKIGKDDAGRSAALPVESEQIRVRTEAIVALMSLGYNKSSAEKALRAVILESSGPELPIEELIKRALRHAHS